MEGYRLDMRTDLTLLKNYWPDFYRVSGKDFWGAQGGRPYTMYTQCIINIRNTLNRLKKNLTEHYDERVRAQLFSEGRPGVAYIETLNGTIEQCPNRYDANNQEPLKQLKGCVTALTEIQNMGEDKLKTCRTCGRTLTIDHFYRGKQFKDGYHTECKDCFDRRNRKCKEARKLAKQAARAAEKKPVAPVEKPTTTASPTPAVRTLQDYTPRELMAELARRGYTGKLEYVERHVIDITNF